VGAVFGVKVAATLSAAFIVTLQAVPLHAPLQPLKLQPEAGMAARLTCVPAAKLALQVAPQLMPAGMLVTVPLPLSLTARVNEGEVFCVKVARTLSAAFIVTLQAPLPPHAPLHPLKFQPNAGVAVRVTGVPAAKLALQLAPQSMPAGALATVPLPMVDVDSV